MSNTPITAEDNQTIPFIRSFIRLDDSPEEFLKAQNGCYWLLSNLNNIKPYFTPCDFALLQIIFTTHWNSRSQKDDFGQNSDGDTLNWEMLKALAIQDNTMGILDRLEEIREDEERSTTSYRTQDDLSVAASLLKRDFEANHWRMLAKMIRMIAVTSWTNPLSHKVYSGPVGCRQYVYESLEKGVLADVGITRNNSYLLNEDTKALIDMYDQEGALHHTIGTGLPHLDEAFQLKRGQLLGILGYNKHRKTTLCRSIAYNAIQQGFNVLWVALEQTAEEELSAFQVMHCHRLFPKTEVSVQKVDRHKLTKEEKQQLSQAGDDLANLPGKLKIIEPGNRSWSMIKQMVEMEAMITGFDIIVIDYLTLVQSANKDTRAGMAEIIMAAKQLTKNMSALLITPIQGNREGATSASATGWEHSPDELTQQLGQWSKEGIDTYSEFSKSCDCIITTWYDQSNCQDNNQIIIGLLLCRRAGSMQPLIAKVNDNAGYIFQQANSKDEVIEWPF